MTRTAIFDEQEFEAFAAGVERFVTERYPFERQRALACGDAGFGRAEWAEMAELGWLALAVPAEHGGLGGGASDEAIIMAGIGRALLLEPFLASSVLATAIVSGTASDDQKAALLSGIAAGEHLYAFAHEDGVTPVIARAVGDCWRLDGEKLLVLHGDAAERLLVTAASGFDISVFLVDASDPGVRKTGFRFVDGRRGADIVLRDARAERLGEGDARAAIASACDRGTLAICAEAVGAMTALNSITLAYAKTREQFGVTIGSFQALQHRLVEMSVAEVETRSIVMAAAEAYDAEHPLASAMVSVAKVRVNGAARLIGERAIQLHGGIGMTDELAAGHYFKRLLAISSMFGNCDHHLDRLAGAV